MLKIGACGGHIAQSEKKRSEFRFEGAERLFANWGQSFGGLLQRLSGVTALVAFACKNAETNAETSDQSFDKVLLP